jgi:hypothetical protein
MLAAATAHLIAMRPSTFIKLIIQLSRATTRRKGGDGVTSTRSFWTLGKTRRRMMDPFRVTTDTPFARRVSRRSSKPAAAAAARWCDEAIDIRKSRRATQALWIFVQSRLAADEHGNRSK